MASQGTSPRTRNSDNAFENISYNSRRGALNDPERRNQGNVNQESNGLTTPQNWEEPGPSYNPTAEVKRAPGRVKRPRPTSHVGVVAPAVAEKLLEIFSRHGIPEEILTDQGANVTSTLLREIYKLVGT